MLRKDLLTVPALSSGGSMFLVNIFFPEVFSGFYPVVGYDLGFVLGLNAAEFCCWVCSRMIFLVMSLGLLSAGTAAFSVSYLP